MLVFEEKKP
jgi:solute carrier family 8 (sodium/calcium exchanger)